MNDNEVKQLADLYRKTLVDDVLPFWLRHGLDREHGGILTGLDRDGTVLETDKAIWLQGRAAWMFSTAYLTVERRPEWLAAAKSCVDFLRRFGGDVSGKLYFLVSREGKPIRMRRYVFSESFAAVAFAAYAAATGESQAADDAKRTFERYLEYTYTPGRIAPKVNPENRPMTGVGSRMAGIVTAQELRQSLGAMTIRGRTLDEWIDGWIDEVEKLFFKPDLGVLMEAVAPDGSIITDHYDGRILNPGHAITGSWFIMREGHIRSKPKLIQLGLAILEGMWKRGWDEEYGGIYCFRDIKGLPVQDYAHDMKFWWAHNESEVATLMAWKLTGERKFLDMHNQVHQWSFKHFPDPEFGEWYGYLHRDGTPSLRAKGSLWKGPFHLPRMLWYCERLLMGKIAGA